MSENTDYETLKAERDLALNTCSLIADALGITGAVAGDTIARVQQLVAEGAILKQRIEAAEAQLLVPWIQRSKQMPDPKNKRRVCVFTPNSAADLRYRLVPANLFKAVCSSATHWHYVDDPVEGGE